MVKIILTDFAVALVVLQQRPSFQEIPLQRPKFVIYVSTSMTRNLGAFVSPTSQGDVAFVSLRDGVTANVREKPAKRHHRENSASGTQGNTVGRASLGRLQLGKW
jgi:hypothetical protein